MCQELDQLQARSLLHLFKSFLNSVEDADSWLNQRSGNESGKDIFVGNADGIDD